MNSIDEEAVPGAPPWEQVTEAAYLAYAASHGVRGLPGRPFPFFDLLTMAEKTALEAAVRHAVDTFLFAREGTVPDLDRWRGWLPPRYRPVPVESAVLDARPMRQPERTGS